VFGHHHVSHDHEAIAPAGLFQNREEPIAAARGVEKRQPPVTGAGDKVQVMGAVGTTQADGHDKTDDTSSIVPVLAKSARAGHPISKRERQKAKVWATRRGHLELLQAWVVQEASSGAGLELLGGSHPSP